ncbi:hypothetical protein OAK51_00690 [Alphaproteobacteria bacterium]|nr:hypothetical protein [Alphaproteobacteria bacterium]
MSVGEQINTVERLIIDASRVSRYLGYPRKVPIWKLGFCLPEFCSLFRDEENSDIALEIENMEGFAIVPSLSKEEALRRLKKLIPLAVIKTEITRI